MCLTDILAISMAGQTCQEPEYIMQSETCPSRALHTLMTSFFPKNYKDKAFKKQCMNLNRNTFRLIKKALCILQVSLGDTVTAPSNDH